MKTKEFIKMLQKEDPSGELHIRLRDGGIPDHIVAKPGYYDGAYSYIDDGYYVITDTSSKIDVYCTDLEEFIWDKKGNENRIRVETKYDKDHFQKRIDKIVRDRDNFLKTSLEEMTFRIIKRLKEGWIIVQQADKPTRYYNNKWFVKDPDKFVFDTDPAFLKKNIKEIQQQLCQGECGVLLETDFFMPVQRGKLIYWELNLCRDQN